MKTLLVLALTVTIAGCAVTREQAQGMTDYELCKVAITGKSQDRRSSAVTFLRERGENCNSYASTIVAERNNNHVNSMNAMAAGATIMNNSRSYAPRQQTCTYETFGGMTTQRCY